MCADKILAESANDILKIRNDGDIVSNIDDYLKNKPFSSGMSPEDAARYEQFWVDNYNIESVIKSRKLTLEDFNVLKLKDVSDLSNSERILLKDIREQVPMPDSNTLLQKVIPIGDMEKYMDGTYTQVGGFMTRVDDVAQLKGYDNIYDSLRLDYPDSAYKPDVNDSLAVIRYNTNETPKIEVPYSIEFGGTASGAPPFTGNGFTKATNGQIIPEFKSNGFLKINDGAQLIEINKEGFEILRAVYDEDFGSFIAVD